MTSTSGSVKTWAEYTTIGTSVVSTSTSSQTLTTSASTTTPPRSSSGSITASGISPPASTSSSASPVLASSGLSTGVKAGIGVGVGLGAFLLLGALLYIIWLHRRVAKAERRISTIQPVVYNTQEQGGGSNYFQGVGEPHQTHVHEKQPSQGPFFEKSADTGRGGSRVLIPVEADVSYGRH